MSASKQKQKHTDIGPIFTIGHSTRTLDELVELLHTNGVEVVVDVRTVPRSRTNPQFNAQALENDLPANKIEYVHMPDLGGLRHARSDSPNTVWENASFRGYADYMETEKFRMAVDQLLQLASKKRIAIMCAEAVWWRCHRGMISDELVARGIPVEHIGTAKRPQPHFLRTFAHVEHNHVSYR